METHVRTAPQRERIRPDRWLALRKSLRKQLICRKKRGKTRFARLAWSHQSRRLDALIGMPNRMGHSHQVLCDGSMPDGTAVPRHDQVAWVSLRNANDLHVGRALRQQGFQLHDISCQQPHL